MQAREGISGDEGRRQRATDEAPEADVIEQRLEVAAEDDTDQDIIRDGDALSDREANPADVIEQTIVVPDPEDDYGPG